MFKTLPALAATLNRTPDTYTLQDQEENHNTHTGTHDEMMNIIRSQGGLWRMENQRTGLGQIISYRLA